MKTLLRIEEAFLFLLSIFLFSRIGYAWWWFPLLLFAPDIGMLGYLAGPRAGAWLYNFIHHRALAVCLYVLGALLPVVLPPGLYLFEIFFGLIQAYVFYLLATVFMSMALVSHHGEEHAEAEH